VICTVFLRTCVGVCVAKAIVHHHFTDEELVAEIVGVVGEEAAMV